jgi:hypothetical protein
MSYLDAWNAGFEEGKSLIIKLINQHSGTEFKSVAELILFVKEAKEEPQDA